MLALVKTKKGKGFVELREVPVPEVGADEVLIEVKAVGICATDIRVRNDDFFYWPPVILGHEFSGQIAEVGAEVEGYKVGDRVVAELHCGACGKCHFCRTGNIQICSAKRSPGWGMDGAFTKYIKMAEKLLHRIPENVSFEEAAMTEPLANVVYDVLERGRMEAEDFVVVLGLSPGGVMAAMAAKAEGAREAMLVRTAKGGEMGLRVARETGIQQVVDATEEDPVEKCLALTDGRGADLVVEASGTEAGINMAVELVRKKGRITTMAIAGRETIQFAWDKAIFKVCDIIFNFSTSHTSCERAISLMAGGKVNVKDVISHCYRLGDWEKAFNDVEERRAFKALLIP